MIGRGLLANPALAEEFTDRKALSPEERVLRFRRFHDDLFAAYSARLQGDAHLLRKMQAFWEEFMPWTNRKLLKQIHTLRRKGKAHEKTTLYRGRLPRFSPGHHRHLCPGLTDHAVSAAQFMVVLPQFQAPA